MNASFASKSVSEMHSCCLILLAALKCLWGCFLNIFLKGLGWGNIIIKHRNIIRKALVKIVTAVSCCRLGMSFVELCKRKISPLLFVFLRPCWREARAYVSQVWDFIWISNCCVPFKFSSWMGDGRRRIIFLYHTFTYKRGAWIKGLSCPSPAQTNMTRVLL